MCQDFHTGVKQEIILEKIKELPESYLPDAQDYKLAETMRSVRDSQKSMLSQANESRSESKLLKDDSILSLQGTQEGFNLASE